MQKSKETQMHDKVWLVFYREVQIMINGLSFAITEIEKKSLYN